jgi:hypothetical protein
MCYQDVRAMKKEEGRGHGGEEMSHLMPTLSGDVSRILLFLKAVWYGRHEEILSEFLLTVKKKSVVCSWRASMDVCVGIDCPRA